MTSICVSPGLAPSLSPLLSTRGLWVRYPLVHSCSDEELTQPVLGVSRKRGLRTWKSLLAAPQVALHHQASTNHEAYTQGVSGSGVPTHHWVHPCENQVFLPGQPLKLGPGLTPRNQAHCLWLPFLKWPRPPASPGEFLYWIFRNTCLPHPITSVRMLHPTPKVLSAPSLQTPRAFPAHTLPKQLTSSHPQCQF